MADSGDTAMIGMVLGGVAGYALSDGNMLWTVLGAGAGATAGGPVVDKYLMEPEAVGELAKAATKTD